MTISCCAVDCLQPARQHMHASMQGGRAGRCVGKCVPAARAVYLTADDVIAATRDTMEDTIDYINEKHGGIVHYLQEVPVASQYLRGVPEVFGTKPAC